MSRAVTTVQVVLIGAALCRGDSYAEQAAPAEAVTPLFDRARVLLNQARFEEAVRLLERAAGLATQQRQAARIHLYLGIGHWLQGRRDLAHAAFVAALTKDVTLSLDPDRHKPELVAAFHRARDRLEGRVEVRGSPRGAKVLIDGEPAGRLPLSRTLSIGAHTVRIEQDNQSFQRKVIIKPDARVMVTANLPRPASQPASPPARVAAKKPRRRIWTWIAAGSAVVAAGVGLGVGVSADADYDEYLSTTDKQRYEQLSTRVPRMATGANVAFGVAGALAIGAVVLYLLE